MSGGSPPGGIAAAHAAVPAGLRSKKAGSPFLVDDISERRFRSLCREFGFEDLAKHYAPLSEDRQSGNGLARCQWHGRVLHDNSSRANTGPRSSAHATTGFERRAI